jgi:1-acyl-sn-glycerol-3-phosphate acyltransferase
MPYQTLQQTTSTRQIDADEPGLPIVKLIRLLAEFVRAGLVLWLLFPKLQRVDKLKQIQRWAKNVLLILNVEVHCDESAPNTGGGLLVANHISWLDILVIQSLAPGVFVAKSEVRRWPLIGSMAHACNTIFVERSSHKSARAMIDDSISALGQGYSVIAFPEGTSSDGSDLGIFHANIFEGAIKARTYVHPVTLRYVNSDSDLPNDAAPFIGDMTLVSSLRKVMATSTLRARVHIGESIQSAGHTRKTLANLAHHSIRRELTRERQGLTTFS